MQLTPRYDGAPVVSIASPVGDPAVPLLRQRRRLADALDGLSSDDWQMPTRCDGWSVQDVIAHLIGTNQFWAVSLGAGIAGEPTRYLGTFDPVQTPAAMVDAMRSLPAAEVGDRFRETNEAIAAVVSDLAPEMWGRLGEAPPGHVTLHAVVLHALWDAWTHERDVLLPLGVTPAEETDEIAGCLRYAAAIGPSLRLAAGGEKRGTLVVRADDHALEFVVEVGDTVIVRDGPGDPGAPTLVGNAVALVEGLTFRAPLDHDLSPADQWLLGGLDAVFDRV